MPESIYAPNCVYSKGIELPTSRPRLVGSNQYDVLIVGGGYTGLSAGLHLAERGVNVAIVEAERVGWGASGRNGGQIHSGQRQDPSWFEKRFGLEKAREYFQLGEAGKTLVKQLITKHHIECELACGLIDAVHRRRLANDYRKHIDYMNSNFDHPVSWLNADETSRRLGTKSYFGAIYDPTAGHLHPLKFALGLARAAEIAGCSVFENSKVKRLIHGRKIIAHMADGDITADQVLLCGNGYISGLEPKSEARIMPIHNYIAATRPLAQDEIPIPGNECAADSRFVINYWRMSADNRLLFGGGESYSASYPSDITGLVLKAMKPIYPQFSHKDIEFAWGGTLAVTVNRLPYVRQVTNNCIIAGGYSGQGVTIAPLIGQILADSLTGEQERLEAYSKLPMPPFPGGRFLRYPAMVIGMAAFALRDKL